MKLSDRIHYGECGQTKQWLFDTPLGIYRLIIDDSGWRFRKSRDRSTLAIAVHIHEPYHERISAVIARLEAEEKSWPIEQENYAKESV